MHINLQIDITMFIISTPKNKSVSPAKKQQIRRNTMFTNYDNLPLMLTAKDAASTLNIGKNTMYELLRCGAIHSVKVGNQYRIPKESIKHLLGR